MVKREQLALLFKATRLGRPEDAVGFLLWRVAHRYQREIDRACVTLDLTHLQFVVLVLAAWLGRTQETVTQAGLASFSGIHPMQLSNVLKALEAKDLIARARSAADVRVKEVQLTVAGLELLSQALPLVEQAQRRFFGPDEAAGEQLHHSLRRIVGSWEADG